MVVSVQSLLTWSATCGKKNDTYASGLHSISRFVYTAAHMLSAIRLSLGLRGGATKLANALHLALEISAPKPLAGMLKEQLGESGRQPGASTLRRAELCLYVGLMLFSQGPRRSLAPSTVIYL